MPEENTVSPEVLVAMNEDTPCTPDLPEDAPKREAASKKKAAPKHEEPNPLEKLSKKELIEKIEELTALNESISNDLNTVASSADELISGYRKRVNEVENRLRNMQGGFDIIQNSLEQTRNLVQLVRSK